MNDLINGFKEFLEASGKSQNTINGYLINIKFYFSWFLETFSKYPEKLYRENVLDYKSFLINIKHLNAKTINHKLSSLKKYNEYLVEIGKQTESVIRKNDFLKVQQDYASPSKVNESEVKAFIQEILEKESVRDYALVMLLAYTGVRISEALSIKLGDFNLQSGECIIRSGKGGKQRLIPLNSKVTNAIAEYLKQREKYKYAKNSEYLFTTNFSSSLDRSSVHQIFKKHSDKITPHQLRHFFCTNALEKGLGIHEVANIAGHSNIHTTMIYTNPDRQKLKDKVNQL